MRIARHVTALALALACTAPPAVADDVVVLPTSIASLGDSITRGFNACGFYVDCTRRSWSTGDDGDVDSHRLRLRESGSALRDQANLARTGADSKGLAGQAERAVAMQAEYVTIEIGANDACRRTPEDMTPVDTYRQNIAVALGILHDGVPNARVFVASIPDLKRLWFVGHTSWYVRKAWNRLHVCQSMLRSPGSTAPVDEERRNRVRERTIRYNEVLAELCADYGPLCMFDDDAVFFTDFTRSQVSKWDFFHPNKAGQRLLARVTWQHGFFADRSPAEESAAGRPLPGT
jgi:lysophospholipase L1-like esterase